ncbi:MAG: hypothetical protein E7138_01960 [Rikenellaceae bacterium]|jgi:hypothetical protein|nr:hypothetical protein [Rikenellaceae bacterium]
MKHRGCKCEYAEERNNDLMRAYIEEIESCDNIVLPQVFSRIVNKPSKRFWVSAERAAIVVSSMMRGNRLTSMSYSTRKEMFYEIYRRVVELKEKYPTRSIYELTCQVVLEPAPKFYLTAGSAKVIIHRTKKRWYERRMQRLQRLHCQR